MSLWQVTMTALWRRKRAAVLLMLVAALGAASGVLLNSLVQRQKVALDYTIENTVISCVITDAQGKNQELLHMPDGFVARLTGHRHEQGYFLDDYVTDVKAAASIALDNPYGYKVIAILTLDSDHNLAPGSGSEITFLSGWDESVLDTGQKVCLVPEGMADLGSWLDVESADFGPLRLQVIGVFRGGTPGCIYCPFRMSWLEGQSTLLFTDSCSFVIRDNHRIEEARAALYDTFVLPDRQNHPDMLTFGLIIQDDTFQSTLTEIRSNLTALRILLPVLMLLCAGISFFANYLSTRSREHEFGVMRGLGMKQSRVFTLVFGESLVLGLLGSGLGIGLAALINRGLELRALIMSLAMVFAFWMGAAISVWRTTRVNIMSLMKGKE